MAADQFPTINHKGAPIHATEDGIRNFWNWFKDSKVVNEEGLPEVVYHGTQGVFDAFSPEMQGSTVWSEDRGFFFTNYPREADSYAESDWDQETPAPNVLAVYLSLQNPKIIVLDDSDRAKNDNSTDYEYHELDGFESPAIWYDKFGVAAVLDAEAAGHDGLIIVEAREWQKMPDGTAQILYVAFDPAQIKSAIGNSGAFAIDSPSMSDGIAPGPVLHNSKGMPVHPSPEGRVNFDAWFGASAVVDDYLRPLVVYHGTPQLEFLTGFDKNQIGARASGTANLGFFFSTGAFRANAYSSHGEQMGGILPVYLRLPKLLHINVQEEHEGFAGEGDDEPSYDPNDFIVARECDLLLWSQGYDGVAVTGDGETIYIVFDPANIKSAIGNSGAFSIDSHDIADVSDFALALNSDGKPIHGTRKGIENFKQWFDNSVAVDAIGRPLVAYRGEHGDAENQVHSRLGSLSFGLRETANFYAMQPNNRIDVVVAPRVIPVYLKIENPFINRADPFLDLSLVEEKLGRNEALRIALKFARFAEYTSNWMEGINAGGEYVDIGDFLSRHPERVSELYFDAYHFFDDAEEVAQLRALGYDGAIHYGNGETALEFEYKVFNANQVKSAIGNSGAFNMHAIDLVDGVDNDLQPSEDVVQYRFG